MVIFARQEGHGLRFACALANFHLPCSAPFCDDGEGNLELVLGVEQDVDVVRVEEVKDSKGSGAVCPDGDTL
jgi:hypothetical protein